GLALLGWTEGRNVRVDTRWAGTNPDDIRKHAMELTGLALDVIVAGSGTTTVAPLLQATRTVPIIFVVVIDPVGAGFVSSLARPGGNTTASSCSSTAKARNGWRCSARLRRGPNEWLCFGTPQ